MQLFRRNEENKISDKRKKSPAEQRLPPRPGKEICSRLFRIPGKSIKKLPGKARTVR